MNDIQAKYQEHLDSLKELTGMKITNLLFDSEAHDWKKDSSEFSQKLHEKSQVAVVIVDKNNNVFGGYIDATIDGINTQISDENSFVFSLKSNGRLDKPMIFPVVNEKKSFFLTSAYDDCLFSFGDSVYDSVCDIKVMKKDKQAYDGGNQCKQKNYLYEGHKNVLCGDNHFEIERFFVLQMEETEEAKRMKEERAKEREMILKQTKEKQIKQIEEWTTLKFKEVLFDTNDCGWYDVRQKFFSAVFGKEKLAFVMEDSEKNVFGGFVHAKIDKSVDDVNSHEDEDDLFIYDPKTFVFSLESNGRSEKPVKFDIEWYHADKAFGLYEKAKYMFMFGKNMVIYPPEKRDKCVMITEEYNFGDYNHIIVGKYGKNDYFKVERLQVWQMEETEEILKMKEEKEMKKKQLMEGYIQQIGEWSSTKFKEVLFDSSLCDAYCFREKFIEVVYGKEKLAFIIEDDEGNIFGGYLNAKVNKFIRSYGLPCINDPESFIFSLYSNGRSEQPVKFDIQPSRAKGAFGFYRIDDESLFHFGNDMYIKLPLKGYSELRYEHYEFGEKKEITLGQSGTYLKRQFTVKQIQVLQMEETEEAKKKREETENSKNEQHIKQVEEWSTTKFKDVVFDSSQCGWDGSKEKVLEAVLGKDNLAFVMEDDKQNLFGGFVYSKIDKYLDADDSDCDEEASFINDPNSFIFSLYSNGRSEKPFKFDIKSSKSNQAFSIIKDGKKLMFGLGMDMVINVSKSRNKCFMYGKSYATKEQEKIIVGKVGYEDLFTMQRLQIWQMEETEETKRKLEERQKEREAMEAADDSGDSDSD